MIGRRGPTRRQVRRVLLRAGLHAAPGPRPGFLAALAARLAAQAELQLHPPMVALPGRGRRRVPFVAAGLALASAAVLVGALAGWFGRGETGTRLALAAAVDTTVVLPDGTSVAGRSGLALPDGAIVRTGPNGKCSTGDFDLGPALEALVDQGRLRLRSVAETAAALPVAGDPAAAGPTPAPGVTSTRATTTRPSGTSPAATSVGAGATGAWTEALPTTKVAVPVPKPVSVPTTRVLADS